MSQSEYYDVHRVFLRSFTVRDIAEPLYVTQFSLLDQFMYAQFPIVEPGPYTFADAHQASAFVTEAEPRLRRSSRTAFCRITSGWRSV